MSIKPSATDAVIDLVTVLSSRRMPDIARERVRVAFVDCIACMIAGSRTQAGMIIADLAADQGGREEATIVGRDRRVTAADAALVNGTAAHALDFDDIMRQLAHPSVTLVPALLAVGQKVSSSGADLMDSYGIGFEVISRTLRHMNPAHFDRGWHATSTAGVLGATCAIGALLRVHESVLRNAIGIAVSTSAGLRKQYGSMVKPLHAGMAARNAVFAVDLAQRGFVADQHGLDGDLGYLNVYRGDSEPDTDFIELFSAERQLSIVETGLTVKRFSSCGASHAAVDGALQLREHNPELEDTDLIAAVKVTVNRSVPEILFHHEAHTGDEGRFSMEYSLAVALVDGWLGLPQFSEQRIADQRVQALSRRVRTVVDPNAEVDYANWPALIELTLTDGRLLVADVRRPRGHPDNPLSLTELRAKFSECSEPVLGRSRASEALELLLNMDAVSNVNDLAAALAG